MPAIDAATGKSKVDLLVQRWGTLDQEASTWLPHWREISNVLLPRNGRFWPTDRNKGDKRHNDIYDSTGTRSLKVLGAGMMAGMTSPARPWFRLTTSDPNLALRDDVKTWLSQITRLLLEVFARSNTYRSLHMQYIELGAFGTGATIMLDDFDSVIHHHPLTIGEYRIATNSKGYVDTIFRRFDMTVSQLVDEFGLDNVSESVRRLYEQRTGKDSWVTVIHAIEPRYVRDKSRRDPQNMPWASCYFELGEGRDRLLRESGFQMFRALVPRWDLAGGDIYGNSPGMEALGDIKQLQHEQLRKAQGIDYYTKPPLQAPSSFKGRESSMLPGKINYVDVATAQAGIRPAWEVNLRLDHLLGDIQDVRERIRSSFYADLFLMLANQPIVGRMTATEVAERHEEKLLMLGPVLERLHNELLSPLIDLTFARALAAGLVPPPPPDMQGQDLNVEFVSMLAQAQRAIATNGIDRFVGNLGVIAQYKPSVLDKFDEDKWSEIYSDMLGVDPELIVSSDEVAIVRKARADQMQAQQAMMAVAEGAKAGKDMAAAKAQDPTGGNVVDMFSGYGG
jgi:hypothetical protein